MSDEYILTDSQVKQGIEFCFDKVLRLLDNIEWLIQNQKKFWQSSHALGLYTIAIEELGKALLLRDHYQKGNQNNIPKWIFSKGSKIRSMKPHDAKINRAFNELSEACKKFLIGVAIIIPNPNGTTVKLKNGAISVTGMTSGLFTTDSNVDFQVRMKCFYVDWDDENKQWEYELTTHKDYLSNAVRELRKEIDRISKFNPK